VNFLTDPLELRSTLRPTNVMVYSWVERCASVDLTGIFVLVRLTTEDFTVRQMTLKNASSKVVKHERACSDNQRVFILFAFDTFGFLVPKTVNFLKSIQRVIHNNMMSHRSQDIAFKIIGFVI
jgi:hypothetical protein